MAVYSMTGFANAAAEPPKGAESRPLADNVADRGAGAIEVELRSVNGRFLDLAFRLPDEYRGLEPALRQLLTGAFRRGKIELRLTARSDADTRWPQPQAQQLERLLQLERTVQTRLPQAAGWSVHEAMQWCRSGGVPERLDEVALSAAGRCVEELRLARAREGARLVAVLMERVDHLRRLAGDAEPLVPGVVERQRRRFVERWNEAIAASGASAALPREALEERALTEAASYAIRIDVAEELARLRAHLDEFARLLESGGEVGKRLEFLTQELLREANTLGSKAAALELTTISVEMKVSIEQLREQVLNLE